jgi:AAA15 family ATPase/GTPase
MIIRLKVKGFKNLVDVDVRFGPFTCVAGVNGVGKSNLFDAIRFLSALASRPLTEVALSVHPTFEAFFTVWAIIMQTACPLKRK